MELKDLGHGAGGHGEQLGNLIVKQVPQSGVLGMACEVL